MNSMDGFNFGENNFFKINSVRPTLAVYGESRLNNALKQLHPFKHQINKFPKVAVFD